MPTLDESVAIGGHEVTNRLYRAPLLECAGNGPDAVDRLVAELEPTAAAGAGLLFQGATVVRGEGGCAAPGMTRVHDDAFVSRLSRLTDRIHDHGASIFLQLEHGGLRSMETWHAGYRDANPDLRQLAVSRPPWQLRSLDRLGFLSLSPRVLSADDVRELAADFGRAAARAVDAGYDGIHLAGANMGIIQQFLSPFYNHRTDAFGGSRSKRVWFLELVHDEIRARAGDVPLVTKVPAETAAPRVVRRHLDVDDAVAIARSLADIGFDGLVPVRTSTFWDMSIVRGKYPERAWTHERFQDGYADAFGSRRRARAVSLLNRLQAHRFPTEPGWNADLCRRVRGAVDVPVLMEGGLRERAHIDSLLGDACDLAGMARPFYAEPRLPARLLGTEKATAICESCNNCTVPQVTGADGVCRTPAVLERRGELERQGAYEE
ncbi:oxidoreductase [Natronomonas sp.]|uniref:oxidoreductase n=1 Tax=Natronomonas sp. TaxID=2184060 RepID=UPI002FC3515D